MNMNMAGLPAFSFVCYKTTRLDPGSSSASATLSGLRTQIHSSDEHEGDSSSIAPTVWAQFQSGSGIGYCSQSEPWAQNDSCKLYQRAGARHVNGNGLPLIRAWL